MNILVPLELRAAQRKMRPLHRALDDRLTETKPAHMHKWQWMHYLLEVGLKYHHLEAEGTAKCS